MQIFFKFAIAILSPTQSIKRKWNYRFPASRPNTAQHSPAQSHLAAMYVNLINLNTIYDVTIQNEGW